jgi:hypothetical protein
MQFADVALELFKSTQIYKTSIVRFEQLKATSIEYECIDNFNNNNNIDYDEFIQNYEEKIKVVPTEVNEEQSRIIVIHEHNYNKEEELIAQNQQDTIAIEPRNIPPPVYIPHQILNHSNESINNQVTTKYTLREERNSHQVIERFILLVRLKKKLNSEKYQQLRSNYYDSLMEYRHLRESDPRSELLNILKKGLDDVLDRLSHYLSNETSFVELIKTSKKSNGKRPEPLKRRPLKYEPPKVLPKRAKTNNSQKEEPVGKQQQHEEQNQHRHLAHSSPILSKVCLMKYMSQKLN